jgi:hypothetical protein
LWNIYISYINYHIYTAYTLRSPGIYMESLVESIPSSLHGDLSKKLVGVVLGTQDKDAISTEQAKKIIYLWRQDQLATPTGLLALLEAAAMVDVGATHSILDELGLQKVTIALKSLK